MGFHQWQGYWGTARHSTWSRSQYRGATLTPLQHKAGTIPYWTVPNKITPQLWPTTAHKAEIKGTSRQGKILSCLGMTHLTLLHLPCFSHSRLMRLEVTITFKEHIYLRMLIVHLTMFWKHSIHTSSFRVRTKPKALSRYTRIGITLRVNDDNPCTLNLLLEPISIIPSNSLRNHPQSYTDV